jgi:hypothetical protein
MKRVSVKRKRGLLTDRQARALTKIIESGPRRSFRSAAAAVRFLKKNFRQSS